MELEFSECELGDGRDGISCEASSAASIVDPVANGRAIEGIAHEVRERDRACDGVRVQDPVDVVGFRQSFALSVDREERVREQWQERPMLFAVCHEEPRHLLGVLRCQLPDHADWASSRVLHARTHTRRRSDRSSSSP